MSRCWPCSWPRSWSACSATSRAASACSSRRSSCCFSRRDAQALPLIGSLLAFRGVYYMLPLVCGVVVLALSEVHRWRTALVLLIDRLRLDLGRRTHRVAVAAVAVAGLARLLLLGQPQHASHRGRRPALPATSSTAARSPALACGVALLLLLRGLWLRFAATLRWALLLLMVAAVAPGDRRLPAPGRLPACPGGPAVRQPGLVFRRPCRTPTPGRRRSGRCSSR